MSFVSRGLQFLGYSYLLRIPIATWAILIALWVGSFQGSGAEPILRGIFDVASPDYSFTAIIARFATVTLAALLTATSMGVAARLVVCNAHLRFRAAPVAVSHGIELLFRLVPLSALIAVIGTALVRSEAPWAGKLPGVAIGIALWHLLTIGARDLFTSLKSEPIMRFRAGGWFPQSEAGYIDPNTGMLEQRHLFATYQFLLAFGAYVVYFIVSGLDLQFRDGQFLVPTLGLVLVMLTLFCWGLSGMAYFLDRYRVPLILPLAVLTMSSGLFHQSDYFYQGLPLPPKATTPLTAGDMIEAHMKGPDANKPLVLVATTGGGIQAAAWTARVLTGLNNQVTVDCNGSKTSFSHYVRLISSVSGGSIGAMYFAAAYNNGEVDPAQGSKIIDSAESSSLDQVTWGLSYPDLVFSLFPWMKGVGLSSHGLSVTDSGFIFADRGRMLETSWRSRLPHGERDATLSGWRIDAANAVRPAIIFNSTLVETGDRYLLASTGFADILNNKANLEQFQGRWEFSKLYPDSDLRVRTAARLSATFPYVTPAARMLRNDIATNGAPSHDGRFYRPEPHAVDGGYYDNYGMVSLLDWLDNGLQAVARRPKILIIEIRAAPLTKQSRPESSSYGTLFQLTNALQTLANVRGTGQLSHNALDENLMNRIYTPNLTEATFEFSNNDARGCPRNEPLNWHLTPGDIAALKDAWENSEAIKDNIAHVQSFLQEESCKTQ
jgi:hypothetical protein